jgi:predicted secreted Zn-dependent protease
MSYLAISGKTATVLWSAASQIGALIPGADPWGATTATFTSSEQDTTPAGGGCVVADYVINPTYAVMLPSWGSPAIVPSSLLDWWKIVLAHITDHETHHVAIWQAAAFTLPSLMDGSRCLDEPSIYAAWLARTQAAQAAWDATDQAWSPPVYSGPPAP